MQAAPCILRWDRQCPFCGVQLLTDERSEFCCARGRRLGDVPRLPPLPPQYDAFINHPQISILSRKLNLMVSFAALETSMRFPQTHGGMFAIQGKVYH
ncbi:hypothetical protein PUNSTDRAFT_65796, partial [Punctularia strigosozonata HHB-11173 SS5]|uniref:uncharacterized protein n=1 Tax=Punctularia strigosozonata (strain HHB-11173) TaxID=741275 RepID=UPI0004417540